jgi:dTDP-4-dehydrorhamnose 3,5-epimerase
MIDLIVDIRKGSPTYGKIIAYDMPSSQENNYDECIWVPPGFAHGNCFKEDTIIEYLCTGEYSQGCEAGISPYAEDIDWTICDRELRKEFQQNKETAVITDKDKNGLSLKAWTEDERSENFKYESRP